MTTYILAGGNDGAFDEYWQNLKLIIDKHNPRVLSCFFAQPEEKWVEGHESFMPFFKKAFGEHAKFELANLRTFGEQVKQAEIIYLRGGDSFLLLERMNKFSDPEQLFKGKVVIGSSAGANYLSTNFYSVSKRVFGRGSGLTPLNVLVHYAADFKESPNDPSIDWSKVVSDYQAQLAPDAVITYLPEGEFIIYEI